jgi:hypothetical protein
MMRISDLRRTHVSQRSSSIASEPKNTDKSRGSSGESVGSRPARCGDRHDLISKSKRGGIPFRASR